MSYQTDRKLLHCQIFLYLAGLSLHLFKINAMRLE
nr:MAG TPA: hypothetical protein [Caudoviricetes sp.]